MSASLGDSLQTGQVPAPGVLVPAVEGKIETQAAGRGFAGVQVENALWRQDAGAEAGLSV
jgi:hypothetical protein